MKYLALLVLLSITPAWADNPTLTEIEDAIADLNWQYGADSYTISASNAVIHTREDEAFLQGEDAWEAMRLSEGHDRFKPNALIVKVDGPMAGSSVLFGYEKIGYVKMGDWEENIDPAKILLLIQQRTEEQNKVREVGYPKIYIDGWAEKPYLDRQNAIVYWAIKGHDGDDRQFINAKALKLGRKGMSDLVWVGSPEQFYGAAQNLQPALDAYQYQEGFRYADFRPGLDTIAAVGIGVLAYKMLTGSGKKGAGAVGAGILVVILAFAKKLWFLVFLPFVFAWKRIINLFTRKKKI